MVSHIIDIKDGLLAAIEEVDNVLHTLKGLPKDDPLRECEAAIAAIHEDLTTKVAKILEPFKDRIDSEQSKYWDAYPDLNPANW